MFGKLKRFFHLNHLKGRKLKIHYDFLQTYLTLKSFIKLMLLHRNNLSKKSDPIHNGDGARRFESLQLLYNGLMVCLFITFLRLRARKLRINGNFKNKRRRIHDWASRSVLNLATGPCPVISVSNWSSMVKRFFSSLRLRTEENHECYGSP